MATSTSRSPFAAASIMSGAVSPGVDGTSKPHCLAEAHGRLLIDRRAARKSGGIGAHLGPALYTGMTADRHQTALVASDEAPGQGEIDDRADSGLAIRVLGDAHAPDEDGRSRLPDQLAEGAHLGGRRPGCLLEIGPAQRIDVGDQIVVAVRVLRNELVVEQIALEHVLEGARQEGDVTAGRDQERRRRPTSCQRARFRESTESNTAPCPARASC